MNNSALFKSLLLISSLTLLSGAALAQMTIERFSLEGFPVPGDNGCSPPLTFTSGELQIMAKESTDKAGGIHVTFREQLKNVMAVDTEENYYVLVGDTHFFLPQITSVNISAGGSYAAVDSWNYAVVPIGGHDGPKFRLWGRYNVKINANGEFTVENFGELTTTCN